MARSTAQGCWPVTCTGQLAGVSALDHRLSSLTLSYSLFFVSVSSSVSRCTFHSLLCDSLSHSLFFVFISLSLLLTITVTNGPLRPTISRTAMGQSICLFGQSEPCTRSHIARPGGDRRQK